MSASRSPNAFRDRCVEVVQQADRPMSAVDVMEVLAEEFPLCTWLDAHDELSAWRDPIRD